MREYSTVKFDRLREGPDGSCSERLEENVFRTHVDLFNGNLMRTSSSLMEDSFLRNYYWSSLHEVSVTFVKTWY